ncbi:glycoside hydrolase family 31 protein [Polyangium sp. y55x31]|uniref:glycoside hydrolase family 31 protein n=1 Tax=Polyangium sp. y55x31 TaxID=3042688 RepID=UPI00248264DC|nr:glycoside hydrolase family 31 protein [Polyangium sp. y55x31]MDI1479319.1 glycoside hydrolase family 31 protein [Polyangium sp. y55x31]
MKTSLDRGAASKPSSEHRSTMVRTTIDCTDYAPLGDVDWIEQTERGLLLGVGEEKVRVDVLFPDVLRLKISQAGSFDESPTFATCFEMPAPPPFEVRETPDEIVVATARIRLRISKRPFAMDAYREDGSVIFEDDRDAEGKPRGYLQLNDAFVVTRRMGPGDSMYGLGEKTGAFDRRGRNFALWNTDILHPNVLRLNHLHEADHTLSGRSTEFDPYYTSIPLFYHCRSTGDTATIAGFFVDNGYKGNFEFTSDNHYRYAFAGGQYTEYVFAGPDLRGALRAYTFVTGRMAAPPMWAIGHHQCRYHDYTDEEISAIGKQYRERRIPCDVLWLDIGYMDGYRVFTWHPTRYPDAPRFIDALKESRFRVVTIVDPGVKVEPGYPVFDEGRARNLLCKTESGNLYIGKVWPGRSAFPDFVKPEARAWWASHIARHVETGIAGIWNDMNEPATGDIEPFAMRFDRDGEDHPHERYHNQYALLMARATAEGLAEARPDHRTFVLSRAGFAGIQRYAAQWLGDNCSNWEHLQMSVPMALAMGISGQPFIGADIPGFVSTPSPELAARWVQCGALTPFCRYHNHWGEPDQYPWSFGPEVEEICRDAIQLRYRLLPYLYTAFFQASESGDPIARPLVYDFQQDRRARETEDVYLLGEALLVAPVCEPGCTERRVYLPEGTWVDWHTDERHTGGRTITAKAPLDRIPLFARGGYIIPTYASAPESTMGHAPELIVLHVFLPDEDGEFFSELHEDDGLTLAFSRGAYHRTAFRLTRRGAAISIAAVVTGGGFAEFRRHTLRLVLHGFRGREIALDGKALRVEAGVVEFENRAEDFTVELTLDDARSVAAKGGEREALREAL